ncbi:phosphatidylinositol 4-phosphate 5-kinase-like protein 1 [Babylonia areolata]|uniref:phosphatidylinositol 4-phosphate 5-kinase-like protein 1 n=1 Tax=Babylonia areolata TaxID=304850 RepID=UPI003FD62F76
MATEKVGQRKSFSVIVKESNGKSEQPDVKMPCTTAVKYTTSLKSSISSSSSSSIFGVHSKPVVTENTTVNKSKNAGKDTAPPLGKDTVPPLGKDTAPPPGKDTVPPTGKDTVPPTGKDTAPPPGKDTVPTTGKDTAPPPGKDTAPPPGKDTVPSPGKDTAPPTQITITHVTTINDDKGDMAPPCTNETNCTITKRKSSKIKLSQVGVVSGPERVDAPKETAGQGMEDTSSSQPKRDKKFKKHKHSLWYRLRWRHVHMGVVDVDSKHSFYTRLQCMSTGMQSVYSDPDRLGALYDLHPENYTLIQKKELTLKEGTTFLFENYAPAVFATIRRAVSVEENLYMESIISRNAPYLEFISNSRSGQDFFLSANMQFLIKTNTERDVRFLLSILRDYLKHFLSYPHSLLVKYVGCYSVKLPGKKKILFLVMQNIFYPANRIEDRFDVKGCTAGRYQEPDPPGSRTITVLKDQNFFNEELDLGTNRDWFLNQVKADSMFLRGLNVMDYSLLIGRQTRQNDESREQSVQQLVSRITKSHLQESLANTLSIDHQGEDTPEALPGAVEVQREDHLMHQTVSNLKSSALHFPYSLSATGGPNFSQMRRRLLPDCSNALHIIDGPQYRYFFGIVDFLTRWTLKQKVARLWKIVKYGCGEHSTMPPPYYRRRFERFICSRVR